MNFLAHTSFFLCSQIRLTALSLCECRSVICSVLGRVYVGGIHRTTAKILKFDWSMQVTWKWWVIVSQIRLSKRFVFEDICWYSKRKLTNTPAVIFSCYCWGRWFIFIKQIFIVLFWVIIYSYLQKFFKISVLKTLHNSQENTCIGAYF